MKQEQYLVRINYQSGHSIEAWFTEFSWSHGQVNWKLAPQEEKAGRRIVKIGPDYIESVEQLKVRTA